jgi:glycosyltransferase involved in cell wall biosynthesis
MAKILIVSRYVDPHAVGSNRNVYLQAKALSKVFNVPIEILTWPLNDHWSGPIPSQKGANGIIRLERSGLIYNVFDLCVEFNSINGGNIIDDQIWRRAVDIGKSILTRFSPIIVHLHHRHGMDWILQSAQEMGIPTVYSNHDWGLACMRTSLTHGDNSICNGIVGVEKCSKCIKSSRTSLIGRLNEFIVSNKLGRYSMKLCMCVPVLKRFLTVRNAVRLDSHTRSSINYSRSTRIISNLSHCITPSNFGKSFFMQFGLDDERITVLPWYSNLSVSQFKPIKNANINLVFMGRVSPEKGVDIVFEALRLLDFEFSINFIVCGANDSFYCEELKRTYGDFLGSHQIQWIDWADVSEVLPSADIVVLPSRVMDNTPLTLIESLSLNIPVIIPDLPSMTDLVQDGINGYIFEHGSHISLSKVINRAVVHVRSANRKLFANNVMSLNEYTAEVLKVYKKIGFN